MNYWLMKSEPDTYSLETLKREPTGVGSWDGVRNYQARNYLREQRVADQVFFYHSNCAQPGIVGIARIAAEARADPTQFDSQHDQFDPTAKPEQPRWLLTELAYVRDLKRTITLEELKRQPLLAEFALVRKGNRLSVLPVAKAYWDLILQLEA